MRRGPAKSCPCTRTSQAAPYQCALGRDAETRQFASIGSLYGAVFTIYDAQAIVISPLRDGFAGIQEKSHSRCKNFQFGWQVFAAGDSDIALDYVVTAIRPEFRAAALS